MACPPGSPNVRIVDVDPKNPCRWNLHLILFDLWRLHVEGSLNNIELIEDLVFLYISLSVCLYKHLLSPWLLLLRGPWTIVINERVFPCVNWWISYTHPCWIYVLFSLYNSSFVEFVNKCHFYLTSKWTILWCYLLIMGYKSPKVALQATLMNT